MENKIAIPFGEYKIVAEKGSDPDYSEMFIYIEDENGRCIQDIVIVGQKYHYDENLDIVQDEDIIVRVFADESSEDYTHKIEIGVLKGA